MLPHITPFLFEEVPSRGESVQINCYVTKGDVPVKFSWTFNGEPITSQLFSVEISPYGKKSSILTIESVDKSHIGNYSCTASNRAGASSFLTELFVKGMKHEVNFIVQ